MGATTELTTMISEMKLLSSKQAPLLVDNERDIAMIDYFSGTSLRKATRISHHYI